MADSAVAITAGAGTNIDTRTESTNSNHRQVIVVGDPSANAGVAPVTASNGLVIKMVDTLLPWTASNGLLVNVIAGGGPIPATASNGVNVKMTDTNIPWTASNGLLVDVGPGVTKGGGAADGDTIRVTIDTGQLGSAGQTTAASSVPTVIASDRMFSDIKSIAMTTATGNLAANDLIADSQIFADFFTKINGAGVISAVSVVDEDSKGTGGNAIDIILMRTSTSLGTEDSTPNITDANLIAGFQGRIPVAASDYITLSGAAIATVQPPAPLPVEAVTGTDGLYVAIVNQTATQGYPSGNIQLIFHVLHD